MSSNNVSPAASSGLESPVSHGPGQPGPSSDVSNDGVSDDASSHSSEDNPLDNVIEISLPEAHPSNTVKYIEVIRKFMPKLLEKYDLHVILAFDWSKCQRVAQEPSSGNLNLHASTETQSNFTEEAVTILAKFMEELFKAVQCFGYGDVTTLDKDVFAFRDDQRPCNGSEEILRRYRIFAQLVEKGPSISLVPIINTAMGIVGSSGGQHHILIIFTGMAIQLK